MLDYERSALQSGDIFTKGFTALPDWLRATKLINHLDPILFWEGQQRKMISALPNTHKGGVNYDYWSSNPWLTNQLDDSSQAERYRVAKLADDSVDPNHDPRLSKKRAGHTNDPRANGHQTAMPGRLVECSRVDACKTAPLASQYYYLHADQCDESYFDDSSWMDSASTDDEYGHSDAESEFDANDLWASC